MTLKSDYFKLLKQKFGIIQKIKITMQDIIFKDYFYMNLEILAAKISKYVKNALKGKASIKSIFRVQVYRNKSLGFSFKEKPFDLNFNGFQYVAVFVSRPLTNSRRKNTQVRVHSLLNRIAKTRNCVFIVLRSAAPLYFLHEALSQFSVSSYAVRKYRFVDWG